MWTDDTHKAGAKKDQPSFLFLLTEDDTVAAPQHGERSDFLEILLEVQEVKAGSLIIDQ